MFGVVACVTGALWLPLACRAEPWLQEPAQLGPQPPARRGVLWIDALRSAPSRQFL